MFGGWDTTERINRCMCEGVAQAREPCRLNVGCYGNHAVSLRQAGGLLGDFYDSRRLSWIAARKDSRPDSPELDGLSLGVP